jgi:hypothetical protein
MTEKLRHAFRQRLQLPTNTEDNRVQLPTNIASKCAQLPTNIASKCAQLPAHSAQLPAHSAQLPMNVVDFVPQLPTNRPQLPMNVVDFVPQLPTNRPQLPMNVVDFVPQLPTNIASKCAQLQASSIFNTNIRKDISLSMETIGRMLSAKRQPIIKPITLSIHKLQNDIYNNINSIPGALAIILSAASQQDDQSSALAAILSDPKITQEQYLLCVRFAALENQRATIAANAHEDRKKNVVWLGAGMFV